MMHGFVLHRLATWQPESLGLSIQLERLIREAAQVSLNTVMHAGGVVVRLFRVIATGGIGWLEACEKEPRSKWSRSLARLVIQREMESKDEGNGIFEAQLMALWCIRPRISASVPATVYVL
jgi:hypothetical protein